MRAFTIADMRRTRPNREQLKRVIVEAKGNLTQVSAILGCSRPTLYKWIDQHDLRDFAGVRGVDDIDGIDDADKGNGLDTARPREDVPDGGKTHGNTRENQVIIFSNVATNSVLPDSFRRQRSVTISEGLWRWTRVEAAQTDRRQADVVESALQMYREHLAKKRAALSRKLKPEDRSDEK